MDGWICWLDWFNELDDLDDLIDRSINIDETNDIWEGRRKEWNEEEWNDGWDEDGIRDGLRNGIRNGPGGAELELEMECSMSPSNQQQVLCYVMYSFAVLSVCVCMEYCVVFFCLLLRVSVAIVSRSDVRAKREQGVLL